MPGLDAREAGKTDGWGLEEESHEGLEDTFKV